MQAQELGHAKWEFENTKSAFQENMRQFAPGFGAGTFLAKAIAMRSAKVPLPVILDAAII